MGTSFGAHGAQAVDQVRGDFLKYLLAVARADSVQGFADRRLQVLSFDNVAQIARSLFHTGDRGESAPGVHEADVFGFVGMERDVAEALSDGGELGVVVNLGAGLDGVRRLGWHGGLPDLRFLVTGPARDMLHAGAGPGGPTYGDRDNARPDAMLPPVAGAVSRSIAVRDGFLAARWQAARAAIGILHSGKAHR